MGVFNIRSDKYLAETKSMMPKKNEHDTEIFKAVLNNFFNFDSEFSYSAVYFTTPVFIAPLETVNVIATKFAN